MAIYRPKLYFCGTEGHPPGNMGTMCTCTDCGKQRTKKYHDVNISEVNAKAAEEYLKKQKAQKDAEKRLELELEEKTAVLPEETDNTVSVTDSSLSQENEENIASNQETSDILNHFVSVLSSEELEKIGDDGSYDPNYDGFYNDYFSDVLPHDDYFPIKSAIRVAAFLLCASFLWVYCVLFMWF